VAVEGALADGFSITHCARLAEAAARLLGARLLGVSVAEIDGRLVVWDVDPVPGFRAAQPIQTVTVEAALASLTESLLNATSLAALADHHALTFGEGAGDHVVLSA